MSVSPLSTSPALPMHAQSTSEAGVQHVSGEPLPDGRFINTEKVLWMLHNPKGHEILDEPPACLKEDTYYIVDNTHNTRRRKRGKPCEFTDSGCGVWVGGSASPRTVFLPLPDGERQRLYVKNGLYCKEMGVNNKAIYVPLEPQPREGQLLIMQRNYAKMRASYQRRITWVASWPDGCAPEKDVAVYEYKGSLPAGDANCSSVTKMAADHDKKTPKQECLDDKEPAEVRTILGNTLARAKRKKLRAKGMSLRAKREMLMNYILKSPGKTVTLQDLTNQSSAKLTTQPNNPGSDCEDSDRSDTRQEAKDERSQPLEPLQPSPSQPLPSPSTHVTYEIVSHGTQKGFPVLLDSLGYTYTRKSSRNYWICSVRGKGYRCAASVTGKAGSFRPGPQQHCHPPKDRTDIRIAVAAEAKWRGRLEPNKSASRIVREIIEERVSAGESPDLMDWVPVLTRRVNRARQTLGTPLSRRLRTAHWGSLDEATRARKISLKPEMSDLGLKEDDVDDDNEDMGGKECKHVLSQLHLLLGQARDRGRRKTEGSEEFDPLQIEDHEETDSSDSSLPVEAVLPESPPQKDSFPRVNSGPITYDVIENEVQGQPQLIDSNGYTYMRRRTGKDGTIEWGCSVRSKTVTCNATVLQNGREFTPVIHVHCHPSRPNKQAKRHLSDTGEDTGSRSRVPVLGSGSKVIKSEPGKEGGVSDDTPELKSKVPILGLKGRRSERTGDPDTREMDGGVDDGSLDRESTLMLGCRVDQFWLGRLRSGVDRLDFKLEMDLIPVGFLRSDIRMGDARHILLFSANQESLLARADTLYLDKTDKVVCEPFQQILSIRAFIKGSGESGCRHLPLAYCIMSRRRRKDYAEVLRAVTELVPSTSRNVSTVVMDFEVPMWQAVREVFGEQVTTRGCVYHWSKAVWNKCVEYQLNVLYKSTRRYRELVHWLMALPFLPGKHIEEAFEELQRLALLKPGLTRLFQYVETTWILGFWTPEDWSTYRYPVRSESDVEDWVQHMASGVNCLTLMLHQLIILLHRESQVVGGQLRVAKKEKVMMDKRKVYPQMEMLFVNWQRYEEGYEDDLSISQLLSACSQLKGALW